MADQTITIRLNSEANLLGITKMLGGLGSLTRGINSIATAFNRVLGPALLPLAGGLGVGLFGKLTKDAIDNADEMGKAAQRAGTTVEAFSKLAYAGKLADVSVGDLTSASKFLAQWMDKNGQSGRDMNEVFLEQVAVIEKVADGSEKLNMVRDRFGKGAQSLIPLLNAGSEGLRKQFEEAEKLNQVIGVDFYKNAERFNDNLTRIKLSVQGIFNRIADTILPDLNRLTDEIVQWGLDNGKRIGDFTGDFVRASLRAFQEGRVIEFLTLLIQSGFEVGFEAAIAVLKLQLEKLFSVDFLVMAASAGKILSNVLLKAVQLPVDFLVASMRTLPVHMFNAFVDVLNRLTESGFGKAIANQISVALKSVGLEKFGLLGQTTSVLFDRLAQGVRAAKLPVQEFGEAFSEAHKESNDAVDGVLRYMDKHIELTRQLLETGEADLSQLQAAMSAREKLIALIDTERKSREAAAKANPIEINRNAPDKIDLGAERARIELEMSRLEIQKEIHGMRGFKTDSGEIGTLAQEAPRIRELNLALAELIKQRDIIRQQQLAAQEITPEQSSKQELENARELLRLRKELLDIQEKTNDFTFLEKMKRGLQDMADQVKNFGAAVADVFLNGIRRSIDTVADGIWAVIDGTATWADLFRQVARGIISDLIRIALQQVVVRGAMLALAAVSEALGLKSVATSIKVFTASALAGAGKSSEQGGWVGLLIYMGVLAAAVAGITAMAGGFEKGGVVRGGEQFIRVNESGTEAVLNAGATARMGEDTINRLNAGEALENLQRGTASYLDMGGQSGGAESSRGGMVKINIAFVGSAQEGAEWLAGQEGDKRIVNVVKRNKVEIGIPT